MSRHSCGLFTLCVLAAVGISPHATDANESDPVISIRVEVSGALDGVNLHRAQQLTTAIYQQAGVALDWTTHTAPPARSLIIVLATIAAAPAGVAPEAMGVAPTPGDGSRGTTAYVFVDRVISFTVAYRLAGEHVLACAMAHEIGHLLLPPNAHSSEGIMRSNWHPGLFPPKTPGVLGFPPEQARLLRLRVLGR